MQRNGQFPQMRIWALNTWDRIHPACITQSEAGEARYLPTSKLRKWFPINCQFIELG
ncbi:conserved hypothetical protein [Photorhabdus asymbiotica]|uniref:Uncharacterized protein n=1 Tax=Photorhabdus asymbiotica subsp. asymbiotica (strain ATCC 43949 / 3105-77) TaxID=553480 RepID=B6VKR9_PHOAA|nr:conserved hypothetical protein [Photorhabdus asymbiotica]CAR66749.1 conserved hypothetical protein [Photorhabdus asymbiotica subsp. asymbiotica ATCC 43949]